MVRGRRAGRAQAEHGDGQRSGEAPWAPRRRCVGCRMSRPQAELLRLAAMGGEVVPDPGRRIPGRGCYLCRNALCAERAAKGGQIARALKGKAAGPPTERVLGWLQTEGGPGRAPSLDGSRA